MKIVSRPGQDSNLPRNELAGSRPSAFPERARAVMELDAKRARPLPPRVEWLWRQDGFAADIPFTNAMFIPAQTGDIGLLYEAVAQVVDRHEALRTRLVVEDGRPVQIADGWNVSRLEMTKFSAMSLPTRSPVRLPLLAPLPKVGWIFTLRTGSAVTLFGTKPAG